MKCYIEMTDTYGGETNYSWVKREKFECAGMTDRQIVRKAKDLLGLKGVKCDKEYDTHDTIKYKIRNACVVFFITFEE